MPGGREGGKKAKLTLEPVKALSWLPWTYAGRSIGQSKGCGRVAAPTLQQLRPVAPPLPVCC